ncbi:hypothetical protein [Streptomyces lichenis]|uniref:Uncharacterized protein n=1 Tax=Streptomyces lichenis TaxID=2306967 RepID=A0ABT0I6C4_9ACTN|nr:hypothetical protein [Streptomyces lichenis]MCK8676862.1 hypothetical protein [Streptomyces lichenis]
MPAGTDWLVRGKDGRLTAYAAVEDAVLRWTEAHPGGPGWSGPDTIPAPGNDPYLCIAQGADAYVHLVGLRRTRGAGGKPATEVVCALQYQSGLAVRSWETVGNPFPDDPEAAARIGPPTAVVDTTGSLHVFVADPGGGVRHRAQVASGKWNRWADLGGLRITGRVSTALLDDGLMELLAPTPRHLMRWTQPGRGVKFVRAADIPAAPEPDSLSRVATAPGRLTHVWHDRGDRTVRTWRAGPDEAAADPAPLGGPGGSGPVALLRTPVDGHDCTVMVRRDEATGRPAIAAYPTEEEPLGASWTLTGDPCLGAPALALDGRGRVVVAAFGTDGTLRVARQKSEPGLALDAWTAV